MRSHITTAWSEARVSWHIAFRRKFRELFARSSLGSWNRRCIRFPGCIRPRNYLYCVGWGVILCSPLAVESRSILQPSFITEIPDVLNNFYQEASNSEVDWLQFGLRKFTFHVLFYSFSLTTSFWWIKVVSVCVSEQAARCLFLRHVKNRPATVTTGKESMAAYDSATNPRLFFQMTVNLKKLITQTLRVCQRFRCEQCCCSVVLNVVGHRVDPKKALPYVTTRVRSHSASKSIHGSLQ